MSESTSSTASEPFSAESYFATQPPPPTLEEDVRAVKEFVQRQREAKRKVVLVTVRPHSVLHNLKPTYARPLQSGGTTVPLELNV